MESEARWWEVRICCARRLVTGICGRLRHVGVHCCEIEERGEDVRVLRTFLPSTTPRLELVRFAALVDEDARKCGAPETAIAFDRVRACPSGRAWPAKAVGARLLIQPAFETLPPGDRLVVRLLPLFGFGTTHATTLLTLEALEARLLPGDVIADIGCGTAVLSIAAVKLGASRVYAVDADAATVETAHANREFNRIRPEALSVERGSVEQLLALAAAPFDGLLCNTSPAILEELIPRLGAIAHTGTWAVASGFRSKDESRVAALFEVHGWHVTGRRQDETWRAVDALRR